jgi:hypothetical protein
MLGCQKCPILAFLLDVDAVWGETDPYSSSILPTQDTRKSSQDGQTLLDRRVTAT